MKKITKEELDKILAQHKLWLQDKTTGVRADLSKEDLRFADLRDANLSQANLSQANLSNANLSHANLSHANLSHADLRDANLSNAALNSANLSYANLRGANLTDVCLRYNVNVSMLTGQPIYQVVCQIGVDNRAMTLLANGEQADWRWFVGCWKGTEEELRAKAVYKFGGNGGNCFEAMEYLTTMATKNAKRFNN